MQAYMLWCDGTIEHRPEFDDLHKNGSKAFELLQRVIGAQDEGHDFTLAAQEPYEATVQWVAYPWGEAWCDENGVSRRRLANRNATHVMGLGYPILGHVVVRLRKGYSLHGTRIAREQDVFEATVKLAFLRTWTAIAPDFLAFAEDKSTGARCEAVMERVFDFHKPKSEEDHKRFTKFLSTKAAAVICNGVVR